MNQQKGFANIVLIVLVVIIAGVAGYFALVKKSPEVAQQTNTPTPTPTPKEETAGWKTYTNTKFEFMVMYPKDWRAPEYFGGVNTPGNNTYKVENTTAYEYVFTFVPSRIDDFPVIVTVYELSGTNSDASAVREKVIANLWSHCGDKNRWPECKKVVTRQTITVSGNQALLVTVTATDDKDRSSRDLVFIEKTTRVYKIEHSGNSSSKDFELFYKSFTLSQ